MRSQGLKIDMITQISSLSDFLKTKVRIVIIFPQMSNRSEETQEKESVLYLPIIHSLKFFFIILFFRKNFLNVYLFGCSES